MCVPYDDETAGAATLARITEQLNALVSTLSKAMGLDQSAPRLEAYLSGKLQAETDVWVWSPVVKQYYDARSRMARLYATHYDEHTISFGDFLWDRAGSVKRPYPTPHLLKSLVHGLHAASGQYASGLLAAVIRRMVTPEDAARLIAMTLCEGDEHNYPGPPVYPSDDTKDKLAATLGSTMGVMSDHVLAVVLTHVVAQSLPEWQQRLAGGQHTKQWDYLRQLPVEYELEYIQRRSRDERFRVVDTTDQLDAMRRENIARRLRRINQPAPKARRGGKSAHSESGGEQAHNASSMERTQPRKKKKKAQSSEEGARVPWRNRAGTVSQGYYDEEHSDSSGDFHTAWDGKVTKLTEEEQHASQRARRFRLRAQINEDAAYAAQLEYILARQQAEGGSETESEPEQTREAKTGLVRHEGDAGSEQAEPMVRHWQQQNQGASKVTH